VVAIQCDRHTDSRITSEESLVTGCYTEARHIHMNMKQRQKA
jgi:hypothetical protein